MTAVITLAKLAAAVHILAAPKTLCLLQTIAVGHLLGTLGSVPLLVGVGVPLVALGFVARVGVKAWQARG